MPGLKTGERPHAHQMTGFSQRGAKEEERSEAKTRKGRSREGERLSPPNVTPPTFEGGERIASIAE